jgi:hypothetical protein
MYDSVARTQPQRNASSCIFTLKDAMIILLIKFGHQTYIPKPTSHPAAINKDLIVQHQRYHLPFLFFLSASLRASWWRSRKIQPTDIVWCFSVMTVETQSMHEGFTTQSLYNLGKMKVHHGSFKFRSIYCSAFPYSYQKVHILLKPCIVIYTRNGNMKNPQKTWMKISNSMKTWKKT